MENSETAKVWFVSHEDDRTGPFSMEELKAKVEAHELHPRFDLVWKEGMEDWVAAGEVEGLFVKKTEAETVPMPAGEKSSKEAFNEFEYDKTDADAGEEWPGVARGGYFFFIYLFPIIWLIGLFYGFSMAKDMVEGDIAERLPFALACLSLLPFLTGIFAVLQRFQNLGMSRLWFFGLLVPVLNFWLGYRLFACPPGYAERKRLGALGWILAIIYWLPLVGTIGLGAYIASLGPSFVQEMIEKNQAEYQRYLEQAKEMTESAEQAEEKKQEEKGPSIIPVY